MLYLKEYIFQPWYKYHKSYATNSDTNIKINSILLYLDKKFYLDLGKPTHDIPLIWLTFFQFQLSTFFLHLISNPMKNKWVTKQMQIVEGHLMFSGSTKNRKDRQMFCNMLTVWRTFMPISKSLDVQQKYRLDMTIKAGSMLQYSDLFWCRPWP